MWVFYCKKKCSSLGATVRKFNNRENTCYSENIFDSQSLGSGYKRLLQRLAWTPSQKRAHRRV